jgi:hypothetical protein
MNPPCLMALHAGLATGRSYRWKFGTLVIVDRLVDNPRRA